MNILLVSHCCPWPLNNGTNQRIYHLVEAFARRHRVTLVSPGPDPQDDGSAADIPFANRNIRVIRIPARAWQLGPEAHYLRWAPLADRVRSLVASPLPGVIQRWRSPRLVEWLRQFRRSETFDRVWVERTYLTESVRRAGWTNLIVDVDELESVALRRVLRHAGAYRSKSLHYAELAKLYAYERALPFRFRRLVVCKEEDRRFFGANGSQVFVVPNGTPVFPPSSLEREQTGTLLFVGGLDYEPNLDAIRHFREAILPEISRRFHQARFLIVGRNGVPEVLRLHDGERCIVASSVPDVTPYFERAAVVVVPMRLGVGTKLKLLEALGRGKAVVSTTIGAQGIDVRPGIDLEVADDPRAFAEACLRLLADPHLRRRLGSNGRRRVRSRYNWEHIGDIAETVVADDLGFDGRPAFTASA